MDSRPKSRVREDGCEVRRCEHSQRKIVRKHHAFRVNGKFVPARLAGEGAEIVEVDQELPVTHGEVLEDDPDEVWVTLGGHRRHLPAHGCALQGWRRDEDGALQVYPALPEGAEIEVVMVPKGRVRPSKAVAEAAAAEGVPGPPDTLPAPPEPDEAPGPERPKKDKDKDKEPRRG